METASSFDASNGHAFHEQANDAGDLLGRQVGALQALAPVTVGLAALTAAVALVSLAVASKLLTLGSAIMAGHLVLHAWNWKVPRNGA